MRGTSTSVAVLAYEARRPRGVTLVAGHGYSSSKHNLDFLCGFLASHGFAVYSLDFPGHKLGASGGVLGGTDDLIDAMLAVASHARVNGQPMYAMGHSMGALTALLATAADPLMSGVISIATGYGRPSALEAMAGKVKTDFRSGYVDGVTLQELVAGSDARLAQALPKLAGRPQLYIAATRDAMVQLGSVEDLFRRAPDPKTFRTVESDHTYAADNARSDVLQWLNQRHPRH
ncbi:MAG: lysophospholipase [Candidatus Eremiobacteraeota bacterium]|nr:lysophospholipase [Candidatus Eremiobacteraeota bacterium]